MLFITGPSPQPCPLLTSQNLSVSSLILTPLPARTYSRQSSPVCFSANGYLVSSFKQIKIDLLFDFHDAS